MGSITLLAAVAGDSESRIERFTDTIDTLAGENNISVNIIHVYTEDDIEKLEDMYDIDPREPQQLGAAAEHNTAVNELSERLDGLGIENTTYGGVGDVGTEVIELARQLDVDFILIGGRERSPAGKAIFGSTAQSILLNAPMPVISCMVSNE